MRRIGVSLCGTAFHVAVAQKGFERVDKFPDGDEVVTEVTAVDSSTSTLSVSGATLSTAGRGVLAHGAILRQTVPKTQWY